MILRFLGIILHSYLAMHEPAKVARLIVSMNNLLSVILYTVGTLLLLFPSRILRLLKLPTENDASVSYLDLRLIAFGPFVRSGSIVDHKSKIIYNMLDLDDKNVRDVMCPLEDMVSIAVCKSLQHFVGKDG